MQRGHLFASMTEHPGSFVMKSVHSSQPTSGCSDKLHRPLGVTAVLPAISNIVSVFADVKQLMVEASTRTSRANSRSFYQTPAGSSKNSG